MAKVSIEEVQAQLALLQAPKELADDLLARLNQIVEEDKAERDATPKPKYTHVIVGVGPFDPEIPMFLAKIEEGADHNDVPRNIAVAVRGFNLDQKEKKRRSRKPEITTYGAAFEGLSPKSIPEHTFRIVQKTPVIGIRVAANEIDFGGLPPMPQASE